MQKLANAHVAQKAIIKMNTLKALANAAQRDITVQTPAQPDQQFARKVTNAQAKE